MRIQCSASIRSLLQEISKDEDNSRALRSTAEDWMHSESVPWGVLRDLCTTVRSSGQADGPWIHEICQNASIIVEKPSKRPQTKSLELQAHLNKLQKKLDQESYDRMVEDVTEKEREARERAERGLRTYKKQMSFGLHVIVMMGTFYAFGHVLGLALSSNHMVPLAFGLIGMVCALLLETTLFIIRTTVPPHLETRGVGKPAGASRPVGGASGRPAAGEVQQQQGSQGRCAPSSAGQVGVGTGQTAAEILEPDACEHNPNAKKFN